jgi:hypothetical protein
MLSHLHPVEGFTFIRGKVRGNENQIGNKRTVFPKAILTSWHKMGKSPDRPRNCETCITTSIARHKADSSSLHKQHLTSTASLQETTKYLHSQFWQILRATFILGAFAKLRKAAISFLMSVRSSVFLYGITRLPLDGFLLNLILEDFSKNFVENSRFVKLGQE